MAEGGGTSVDAVPQGAQEEEGERESMSSAPNSDTYNPNCVFCKVISKETPATIFYEDSETICFRDHRPSATHHYLVCPKQHIRDPKALTAEHIPMLERMAEVGRQVLAEQGGNLEETRFGFHWPPFIFVRHLHLHVVGPESSMSWFSRNIMFRVDSFAFASHTWLIDSLRKKESQQS